MVKAFNFLIFERSLLPKSQGALQIFPEWLTLNLSAADDFEVNHTEKWWMITKSLSFKILLNNGRPESHHCWDNDGTKTMVEEEKKNPHGRL